MDIETIQTVGIFVSVIGAVAVGTWRILSAIHNVDDRIHSVENRLSERISEEIRPLKKTEGSIIRALVEMQTIMQERFKGVKISTVLEASGSPLHPTEVGERYIRESGLEKILDENREILQTKLAALLPTDYTEYDVQEKARDLLFSLKNDPMMNPVKRWVYNNPLDIELVLRTGGLWLRDDFLKQPRQTAPTPKE